MHKVQEEYLVHPAYPCVIIQELLRATPETIMEEEVDMMSRRRTRLFIRMMRHGPPRKPDGDPNPDGPRDRHSRMYQSMTINKWAKPIPKLDLPPRIHTQKASKI